MVFIWSLVVGGWWLPPPSAFAQAAQFTGIQRLTNREVFLKFNAPAGTNYRVDVAANFPADTNLPRWSRCSRCKAPA